MSVASIELHGVHKSFAGADGHHVVLAGVDLVVAPGEIVAVTGRSGSGKTTLLTLAAGFEAPDAGHVRVLGSDLPASAPAWRDVAVLPQSLGLLDELTVAENVRMPLRLGAPDSPLSADSMLVRLGLDHLAGRFPDEISLGEQQRTALARAAVVRPWVLLADEPTSHQNTAWAGAILNLLVELTEAGTTCLLATHNDAVAAVASRVLELHDGVLRVPDLHV